MMLQFLFFSQPLPAMMVYHPTRSHIKNGLYVHNLREMPERVTDLLFHLYSVISMDKDLPSGVRSASFWVA